MQRRNFIVGVGSASIGGSALLGSGAFSRIESQRAVTIQVAEDPDAYLGLDACHIEDAPTPNSSYTEIDDKGHLGIQMNPSNPTTINDEELGQGINSDSRMWVDNVFQICNQGKEDICIWIEDDDQWPRAPEAYDEERRVDFYLGANRNRSIIGEDNAIGIGLGECICVGLKTNSKSLSEGDKLLEELDNEIRIVADVDGLCFPPELEGDCPIYAIQQGDGPVDLNAISVPSIAIEQTLITLDPDAHGFASGTNYPNGLAFDDDRGVWYFADDDAELFSFDGAQVEHVASLGGGKVAGAAFFVEGKYYFARQNEDELRRIDVDDADPEPVSAGKLDDKVLLGDIAIDRNGDGDVEAYLSAANGESNRRLIKFTLSGGEIVEDPTEIEVIASSEDGDSRDTHGIHKQIAFAPKPDSPVATANGNVLWAHDTDGTYWGRVDLVDGRLVDENGDPADAEDLPKTDAYTDLAQCAFPPAFTEPP